MIGNAISMIRIAKYSRCLFYICGNQNLILFDTLATNIYVVWLVESAHWTSLVDDEPIWPVFVTRTFGLLLLPTTYYIISKSFRTIKFRFPNNYTRRWDPLETILSRGNSLCWQERRSQSRSEHCDCSYTRA